MWFRDYPTERVSFIFGLLSFLFLGLFTHPGFTHANLKKDSKDWELHETEAFNIYYALPDQELAQKAGVLLETEFDHLTQLMGYMPAGESDIYLVPEENRKDYKIPRSLRYGIVNTEAGDLKKELIREFTGILVEQMYGKKGLKDFDPWFYLGIMAYMSDKNSTWEYMDQQYLSEEVLSSLEGEEALEVGKYIWNYLVKMNGEGIVAYILNSARILEDDTNSIEQVTGVSFEHLLNGCRKYYF